MGNVILFSLPCFIALGALTFIMGTSSFAQKRFGVALVLMVLTSLISAGVFVTALANEATKERQLTEYLHLETQFFELQKRIGHIDKTWRDSFRPFVRSMTHFDARNGMQRRHSFIDDFNHDEALDISHICDPNGGWKVKPANCRYWKNGEEFIWEIVIPKRISTVVQQSR